MANIVNITGRTLDADKKVPVIEATKKTCVESPTVVGLKSKQVAVLVALSPCGATEPLVHSSKPNLICINDYMGVAFTGNGADALRLCNYALDNRAAYLRVFKADYPVFRCVSDMTKLATDATLNLTKPMYACELIIGGYDKNGPHIFELGVQEMFLDCHATSLGKRNHVAREYLEKNYNFLKRSSMEDLINYGITAILKTLPAEKVAYGQVKVGIDVFGDSASNQQLSKKEIGTYLKKAIDRFHVDEDDEEDKEMV